MANKGRPKKEIQPVEDILTPIRPKRGPESTYSPDMCDTIIEIASKGGHIDKMLVAIGVKSKDTFYRWQKEHPEFKEAYEYSKLVSQAFWEDVGLLGTLGQLPNFNATTYALTMNNKFGSDYKRGTGGGNTTEITYNQLNMLSPEQINMKIAQKLEKLKSLGQTIDAADE